MTMHDTRYPKTSRTYKGRAQEGTCTRGSAYSRTYTKSRPTLVMSRSCSRDTVTLHSTHSHAASSRASVFSEQYLLAKLRLAIERPSTRAKMRAAPPISKRMTSWP